VAKILKIINGEDALSNILSADIDIDNIDNVFRFAYHLGLNFNKNTPLAIATSLRYINRVLHLTPQTIPLVTEWFNIRQELY
ncbi:hypothetical protein L0N00_16725, partial [Eggerthella lenta]|nr:hypothetical protein [Eggerthella lenta]